MPNRLSNHFQISTRLSLLSDKKLGSLFRKSQFEVGWGLNGVVEVDGLKVFIKKIPLTDLEMDNAFSTKNIYRMPLWYNYGIGSAGFGAFRELAAHHKTTNWVLTGTFSAFPLLHHYRIVKTEERGADLPNLKRYVGYWNGSKTIERYMSARSRSQYQLILFLEHLTPYVGWISKHPSKMEKMFRKAIESADFLRQQGMIHFDAHAHNWLTDGRDIFLSDFGLLLDREFELNARELTFFGEHRYYDYAQITAAVAGAVVFSYQSLTDGEQQKVHAELGQAPTDGFSFYYLLNREAVALHNKKLISLAPALLNFLKQYQEVIDAKNEFFLKLRSGKKTADLYPARQLKALLKQQKILN